ncbi:MAG: DNA-processing protein DprA [Acidimicrobiia bacterium]|nr:DNA-processing protein DprA [Acidimicrobiia bacterium]
MNGDPSPERLADMQARLALVHLSGMGPARVRWLLSRHDPIEVVARLRAGEHPAPIQDAPPGIRPTDLTEWRVEIARLDPQRLLQDQLDQGWTILHPDDARWPFAAEPEPPLLMFCAGDLDLLRAKPSVAIVGTRRCTSVGRSVAHRMALELAEAGVTVVSGLALGIDAAAHKGALDGGGAAVGVVGTGLDVVYPRRNQALWDEVIGSGLLISEYPAGMGPARWRFPARNRLIASLADATVIVESHGRGGALLTADESAERDKPVLAVPGSVLNPAADGTNGLIVDGAIPTRDADDVLVSLGWSAARSEPESEPSAVGSTRAHAPLVSKDACEAPTVDGAVADVVRHEVRAGAISIDALSVLTATSPMVVLAAVQAMADAGEVTLSGSMVVWRSG